MGHKTFIGGTAYDVSGGKTLIGGTGYDVSGGKTLIDGTSKTISFNNAVSINITSSGNSNYCYATINGTKYYQVTATPVYVYSGDTVSFYTSHSGYGTKLSDSSSTQITADGVRIATHSASASGYTDNYTIPSGVSNVDIALSYSANQTWGAFYVVAIRITITTS